MSESRQYRLTTSMPYLLNRLGVRMGGLFSRRIEPYGITLPMYRVLASLLDTPEQKLNEISGTTSVELSTMSRLIGAMVAKGIVTRTRVENDDRAVKIALTADGRKLAKRLVREAQHYEDVAVSAVDPADVEKLKRTLDQIYKALDVLEGELVASHIEAWPLKAAPASAGGRKVPARSSARS